MSFFYTAHNVLLTPLPFIFIFLLLHNFIIFLPQVFNSLPRNFIIFFPLPPPRLFYIFFHPQKKSTSYRPYIDPTLNFFFLQHNFGKSEKKPTTFLLFFHHYHISIVFTPPVVLSFEFGLFGLRLACLACGWPLTL